MKTPDLALAIPLAIASLFAINSAHANTVGLLPPVESQGSVQYITGGIGSDEATAMEKVQSQYALSLEFAERAQPRDQFAAGVNVSIKDAAGHQALVATSDGPFLFANLPAGKYVVSATDDGKTMTRHVKVNPGHSDHVVFVW